MGMKVRMRLLRVSGVLIFWRGMAGGREVVVEVWDEC